MNEAKITCGSFVVASCQSPGAFEFVEAAFNLVSQNVSYGIHLDGYLSVGLSGNDRPATALNDRVSDMVVVVATISKKHFGLGQLIIN